MLALLTSQLHPDANHKEDMVFLREVFSERSLSYLMKVCKAGDNVEYPNIVFVNDYPYVVTSHADP